MNFDAQKTSNNLVLIVNWLDFEISDLESHRSSILYPILMKKMVGEWWYSHIVDYDNSLFSELRISYISSFFAHIVGEVFWSISSYFITLWWFLVQNNSLSQPTCGRFKLPKFKKKSWRNIWVFPKIMVPPNHPFNRVFNYKPSILWYPYFWKHPINHLVGGWTNPSEKYAQVKLDHETPGIGMKIQKMFETTT